MDDDIYGDLGDDMYQGGEQIRQEDTFMNDDDEQQADLPLQMEQPRHALGDADDKFKDLQKKLMESLMAADKWRSAFKEVASLVGFSVMAGREMDTQSVVEAVQRTRVSEQALQDELKGIRRREALLQVQLAERNLEAVELRRELNTAWSSADPNVIQLKQLLLDPALNKEFNRLKTELESTHKELKHVQQELAATNFTQESKIGRQLMAKCRALADENEEMGRELSEGKMHQLEAQLAMAKDFAGELRSNCMELEDHCCMLDEEAEELQREVFALRREVSELKGEPLRFRRDGPPGGGFMGGRGGGGRGGGVLGAFKRQASGPSLPGPPPPGGRFMDPPPGRMR